MTDFRADDISEEIPFTITMHTSLNRICTECGSRAIVLDEVDSRIYCKECDANQPKEQNKLTERAWVEIVGEGAPSFYKRSADDILDEMERDGIGYVAIFRKYDAHPYGCDMPSELRSVCWLLYDEVRSKHNKNWGKRREKIETELAEKLADLPNKIAAWAKELKLDSVSKPYICLFFFENGGRPESLSTKIKEIRAKTNLILAS